MCNCEVHLFLQGDTKRPISTSVKIMASALHLLYLYNILSGSFLVVFSFDQAALRMVQSVGPSVRHTFLTMFPSSYHHEIFSSYYQ